MKSVFLAFLPLMVTAHLAQAADKPFCKVENPKVVSVYNIGVNSFEVDISNDEIGKVIYESMTSVPEELMTEKDGIPKGQIGYRRLGQSINCFKVIFTDCVYYSCNLPFKNLKTGLVGK